MEEQIEAYSQEFPHEGKGSGLWFKRWDALYEATIEMLNVRDPLQLISNPLIMKYRTMTFHDMTSQFLSDPKAIYAFAALWGYYGTPPNNGSAMYFAYAIMSYFKEDIYYLKGTFQKLADAFVKRLENLGGEVCIRNEVQKILVEDKRVYGVELETGETVYAPLVVCNGDLLKMMDQLVGEEHFPKRYYRRVKGQSISMSAFEVFMGVDLPLKEMGVSHETFVYDSYDYADIYNRFTRVAELGPQGIGGLALSCPSLADPGLAPAGKHTAVITTLVPYDIGRNWKEEKPRFEEALIPAERAVPGLRDSLEYVESGTPTTMEYYTNNSRGAIYGWEQNLEQTFNRPQMNTPIKGLYLSGRLDRSGRWSGFRHTVWIQTVAKDRDGTEESGHDGFDGREYPCLSLRFERKDRFFTLNSIIRKRKMDWTFPWLRLCGVSLKPSVILLVGLWCFLAKEGLTFPLFPI